MFVLAVRWRTISLSDSALFCLDEARKFVVGLFLSSSNIWSPIYMETIIKPCRITMLSALRRSFVVITLVLGLLALSPAPKAFGVLPAPDGGYPNQNTAEGTDALFSLTTGYSNTATGSDALYSNTTGYCNTANGVSALYYNTTGSSNTANGLSALQNNTTGSFNTADGRTALLSNTTGSSNIALGSGAGFFLTTGDNNIDIGNVGVAGEANTIRIGDPYLHLATFIAGINGVDKSSGNPVFIDADGQLGTGTAATGSTGATGPTGATGATGSPGTNGTSGTNGTNGATGPTGPTGIAGTNGSNGATGGTGANG